MSRPPYVRQCWSLFGSRKRPANRILFESLALFAGLVTFDNLTDYETNSAFDARLSFRQEPYIRSFRASNRPIGWKADGR